MKKIILYAGLAILIVISVATLTKNNQSRSVVSTADTLVEKVYVAVEGSGTINVIDPATNKSVKVIDLTEKETSTRYMPHNVQTSPDGTSIWVTANAEVEGHGHSLRLIPIAYAHDADEHEGMEPHEGDQVIVIDPRKDTIIKRIPIGEGQHLAHVVLSPDSQTAYAVAQETNKLYPIDTQTFLLKRAIDLPAGSGPHGLRISPDGQTAYVALLDGQGLGIVDLTTGDVEVRSLEGIAVQTAVTPDGKYVLASIYDARSVALYDTNLKTVSYITLPESSQGPLQLYPTSDSRFVYVADQGVLYNRPANNKLYKLDVTAKTIVDTIVVGKAPHGVVVSEDNQRVYVTNLEGDTVSVIDAATKQEITQIPVGSKPNGISIWRVDENMQKNAMTLADQEITVYKTKTCGCCHVYVDYLEQNEMKVTAIDVTDLDTIKNQYGVPSHLQSCHTSVVGDYVIEGHVPLQIIVKLLAEKPAIKGIALPGMPSGSPGMPGPKTEPWTVYAIANDGTISEFMTY